MAYLIDSYTNQRKEIDSKWVISRPLSGPFITRLKDAWLVICGKADAVRFYKQ